MMSSQSLNLTPSLVLVTLLFSNELSCGWPSRAVLKTPGVGSLSPLVPRYVLKPSGCSREGGREVQRAGTTNSTEPKEAREASATAIGEKQTQKNQDEDAALTDDHKLMNIRGF